MDKSTFIITVARATVPIDIRDPSKTQNRMLENLKGLISEKSKELTIPDGILNYGDIWKALILADTTMQIIICEADYKKLFEIVKAHKGWGEFGGQFDAYTALEQATKQDAI